MKIDGPKLDQKERFSTIISCMPTNAGKNPLYFYEAFEVYYSLIIENLKENPSFLLVYDNDLELD